MQHQQETRPYEAPGRRARAQATRLRVLETARELFTDQGYAGCGIRMVADRSGVSVATVESLFPTKSRLLKCVIELTIAGDDQPIGVLERDRVTEALAAVDAAGFLRIACAVLRDAQIRSADLLVVARQATADAELAAVLQRLDHQRLGTAQWLVDQIADRWTLRTGLMRSEATDTVWALMDAEMFRRLTRDRQWSTDTYAEWMALTLRHLLLADSCPPGHAYRRPTGCG